MGGYDEGVTNLERFIGVMLEAREKVQETATAMKEQADELDRLEGTAGAQLDAFNDALEAFEEELGEGEAEAVAQLDKVAEEGRQIADERLSEAGRDISDGEAEFERSLQVGRDDLDKDATSLSESGFQLLLSALETVEDELDASRQQTEAAYQAFDGAVQGFQQEAETAFDQGEQAADAAVAALNDEHADVAGHATDCEQGFQDGARALEAECGTLEAEGDSAYQDRVEDIDRAGQDLMDSVSTLGEDTAAFVVTSSDDQIDTPLGLVMADAVPPLLDELGELANMLAEAERAVGELETLVQDLEKCKRLVKTIDDLLNAIE